MNRILTTMAAGEQKGFFEALGIDWQLLILQTVAFLVLLWFLAKFVYPPLSKAIEKREADIEAGVKAAAEAEKKADQTKEEVEKLLKQARTEASSIVTTAKEEAAAAIEAAETKAKVRGEHIVTEAHAQLEKDIAAARKTLHNETLTLVALATEKVVGKTVTPQIDEAVIAAAVKEAK